MGAPEAQPSENSLRLVLHFAVAERPVFACGIDETDEDVTLGQTGLLMNFVCDLLIEGLLDLRGTARDPGHLDEYDVSRVLDSEIAVGGVHKFGIVVTSDELKFVVRRDIRDIGHGRVDGVADDARQLRWCALAQIDTYERHVAFSFDQHNLEMLSVTAHCIQTNDSHIAMKFIVTSLMKKT